MCLRCGASVFMCSVVLVFMVCVCVCLFCYDTTQHNVVANNNSTHQEHRHHTAHENTKTSDDSHFLTENRNIKCMKGQKHF